MKKIYTLLFAVVLLAGLQEAQAQMNIQIGPRGGYEIDQLEEAFIGADARIEVIALPIVINPAFDYYFVDGDGNLFQLNLNALYNFGFDNSLFTPYAGLGVGFTRFSPDVGDANTETGLNIVGGAVFGFGSLRPFVQAQTTLGDADLTTLGGGVLFSLGR